MKRLCITVAALAGLGLPTIGTGVAAVISDFESPTYTTGTDINGVDQWFQSFTGGSIVYPDVGSGLVLPTYPPLEDGQSVYVLGRYSRPWGAAAAEVGDGATLSWRVRTETDPATGQSWFFLSDNVAGGSTPAGVLLNEPNNHVHLFGDVPGYEFDTGYVFTNATTYEFEMVLNFNNDEFSGYVTDISNGGSRTYLGTVGFASALDADTTAASGGVILGRFGGTAAMWDAIEINPLVLPAGQLVSDFEPPTYTSAADINGVDGWFPSAFGPIGVVTPDPGPPGSGYVIVMEGLQSYVLAGGTSPGAAYIKAFPAGTQFNNDSILSWLVWTEVASNEGHLFLLPDVDAGATPVGAGHNTAGNFVLQGGGTVDTGIPMEAKRVYLIEIEFDWLNLQYTAYATDIFSGVPRVLLGVRPIVGVTLDDFTDGDAGVSMWRLSGGTGYDLIQLSAGTVPLSLSGITADAGAQQVVVSWDTQAGEAYTVRRAEDLTAGFTTELAAGLAAGVYTDDVSAVDSAAYRVEQEP